MNKVIRNVKDKVYFRQGDSSIKLTYEQIRSLEYDRNSVLLILENNIEKRLIVNSAANNETIKNIWNDLTYPEQKSIEFIINNNGATREEISNIIGRSRTTSINLLNRLIKKDIIIWTGTTKNDNYGKYIIKNG